MTLLSPSPAASAAEKRQSPGDVTLWGATRRALLVGAGFGALAFYAAVVGLLTLMQTRWILVEAITLSQAALITLAVLAGMAGARSANGLALGWRVVLGALSGLITGAFMALLLAILVNFSLRSIFIALSPDLRRFLMIGAGFGPSAALWLAAGAVIGAVGAALALLPARIRAALWVAWSSVIVVGALQQLLMVIFQRFSFLDPVRDYLFTWDGLVWRGGVLVGGFAFLARLAAGSFGKRASLRSAEEAERRDILKFAGIVLLLALLPALAGAYIGQVLMLVGLYALMGMGLNIEVGLAGLLDLGFVAFFAVGAYVTGLLTADSPFAFASYTHLPSLSFWQAMPIAVLLSVLFGVIFGIPVLGVRGDYLAIATLGLGEIVRVIVLSDMAAPVLGGADGVLRIPKPWIGAKELHDPADLFYLTLACSLVAAYVAWRLQHSRLGRAWVALREDEDVAQALGINLVHSKLLAYGLGAAFAGLAGAIFASMLTSVYPNSFTLQVSINVLALIVIGGSGSIQGVLLGAVLLVGLPELFREFGEYRFLFYGVALVIVMIKRPNGLWSSTPRAAKITVRS